MTAPALSIFDPDGDYGEQRREEDKKCRGHCDIYQTLDPIEEAMLQIVAGQPRCCLREVIPGHGDIDYKAYLDCLSELPIDAPLMLEHVKTADEYAEGRHYIQGVAKSLGLSLGGEGE